MIKALITDTAVRINERSDQALSNNALCYAVVDDLDGQDVVALYHQVRYALTDKLPGILSIFGADCLAWVPQFSRDCHS